MCPRPRPETIGTGTPAAAAIGARIREVLSPTPPVLCLSIFRPGVDERSTIEPDFIMASVRYDVSSSGHPPPEDRHEERGPLVIGDLAADPGDHPVDLLDGEGVAISLLPDDVDGSHGAVDLWGVSGWC